MHRFPRGQFSILALLAAMGSACSPVVLAADLPPFAVDPELLGLPAAKPVAPPVPAAKPSSPAPIDSAAAAAAVQVAPPLTAGSASAGVSPAVLPQPLRGNPQGEGKNKLVAKSATKPVQAPRANAPIGASTAAIAPGATAAAAGAVPSPAVVVPVVSAPAAPLAAPLAATAPAVTAAPNSAALVRNMAVFKVDPALLGLPAEAAVTATAVARGATAPAAASGVAVAPLPAGTARVAKAGKGGLVPGQVMPEPAQEAMATTGFDSNAPRARSGHVLARNMDAFRVDPALLDPADRLATTTQAAAPSPLASASRVEEKPGKKGKALPQPKLSIVPSAILGGTYFPPLYAGAAQDRKSVPVYITADRIDGTNGVQSVARGNADLIKADSRLRAEEIIYREQEDEVEARGNVVLTREGDEISGPHLKLNLGDSLGYFDAPVFRIDPRPSATYRAPSVGPALSGYGKAARLDFQGEDHYHLDQATYSSCTPGEGGQAWFAKVASLDLNYADSIGEARDGTVYFKNVPILYSPWLSFSLNRQRKSGFLSPTWGTTTNAGMEFSLPYYWNIAPEMDATITPRVMAKRGTQFQGEFRYMGDSFPGLGASRYQGVINAEVLSNDKLTNTNRHLLNLLHSQDFGHGLSGRLQLSGVSDDSYFTDLSSSVSTIAQTNLVRQGSLNYGAGWWNATALVQRYQTLQPPGQRITRPYERMPQVTLNAARPDLPLGFAFNFNGEFVSFKNPNGGLEGQRTTFYPQLSLPVQTAAFYLTPKIGVHNTRYQLEQQSLGLPTALTRSVPIFSVDSGLVFERDAVFAGRNLIQTLEPRLYYLNVPLRDQRLYPVFDTGIADFNFAQIFAENSFSGGDRIADANQATLALSSRLISPVTGAELARVGVGQRWYFSDQSVVLPGQTPRSGHMADYLAAASIQMERSTSFDSAIQYNPRDQWLERFNATLRYQPETGRAVSAGYRYTRNNLSQVDISGQWPLGAGWSGVGRYNYSFQDKRLVENILGLEYNESCWAMRFVLQRVATTTGSVNNTFFAQLQLNGFSSLGSNPVNLLRRTVSGYDKIVEPEAEETNKP